jgi:hypothetical protein
MALNVKQFRNKLLAVVNTILTQNVKQFRANYLVDAATNIDTKL